jgi:hypothetical protein
MPNIFDDVSDPDYYGQSPDNLRQPQQPAYPPMQPAPAQSFGQGVSEPTYGMRQAGLDALRRAMQQQYGVPAAAAVPMPTIIDRLRQLRASQIPQAVSGVGETFMDMLDRLMRESQGSTGTQRASL